MKVVSVFKDTWGKVKLWVKPEGRQSLTDSPEEKTLILPEPQETPVKTEIIESTPPVPAEEKNVEPFDGASTFVKTMVDKQDRPVTPLCPTAACEDKEDCINNVDTKRNRGRPRKT